MPKKRHSILKLSGSRDEIPQYNCSEKCRWQETSHEAAHAILAPNIVKSPVAIATGRLVVGQDLPDFIVATINDKSTDYIEWL